MELDELIRDAPPPADQVVEGVLVVRAGERWAKVDGQAALWGPLVGADHLVAGAELVFAQVQDGTPFVIWPGAGGGGEVGPEGPQGPPGPTGPKGDEGDPGPIGPKGDTGSQGPQGATGATGATGSQGPQGVKGDTGAQGVKGDTGDTGAQGIQGPQGIQGIPGVAEAWHSGASSPAGGLGVVGDWHLNTTSGDVSEKTGASAWTVRGNIRGPQGATGNTGTTGTAGAPGSVWRSGSGAPAGALGVVGDWYLNTANGDVYEKTGASSWTVRDNITGPQGAQGIQGTQGIQGATGNTGTAGAAGAKWYTQAGAPAGGTGAVGDFALNSTNGDYYEKTGASTWTLRGNLKGPTGSTGSTGSQGPQGNPGVMEVYEQPGTPAGGASGAIWIDTDAPDPAPILAVPLVSVLPSSPADGTEVNYQTAAMAAKGVVWRLRYRSGASGSYKWEFVGGPAWREEVNASMPGGAHGATIDGTPLGPLITLPLAGDYTVAFGCQTYGEPTTPAMRVMGVSIPAPLVGGGFGNEPYPGSQASHAAYYYAPAYGVSLTLSSDFSLPAAPAGLVLKCMYYLAYAACSFAARRLEVTPVRLG